MPFLTVNDLRNKILKLESSWKSEVTSAITLCKVVTSDLESNGGVHFSSMRTLLHLFTVVAYVEPHRTINANITDTLKWCFLWYWGTRAPLRLLVCVWC